MEQKKILFVVAAVSVFALVIFGFALVISSPARTASESERQTASAAIPGRAGEIARRTAEDAAVDPDAWIRSPEAAPGLDAVLEPVMEAESLTSISPAYIASAAETQEAESAPAAETISVRELASRPAQAGRAPRSQSETASEAQGNGAVAASDPERGEQAAQSANATAKPAQAEARVPAAAASTSKDSSRDAPRQTVVEYWIQTGSFTSKLNAESARKMLAERYLNAEIFTKEIDGSQTYRVRVGPYADKAEADYWLGTIAETPEFSGSYVSRVTAQR